MAAFAGMVKIAKFCQNHYFPGMPTKQILEIMRANAQRLYPHINFSKMDFEEIRLACSALMNPKNYASSATEKDLFDYIRTSGPAEWHKTAVKFNWDGDLGV